MPAFRQIRNSTESISGESHDLDLSGESPVSELPGKTDALFQADDSCDLFHGTGLVIMASGFGKRFGSNKLLADFDGQPLFHYILEESQGLFEWRLVVTRYKEVEAFCKEAGIQVLLHDEPGRNDTVRLGLKWMLAKQPQLQTCIFTPADQPLLKRKTLIRLAKAAEEERDALIRLRCGERIGTPTAFPAWSFRELLELPEGKGGNVLLKKYPEWVKEVEAGSPAELMDVDTPEGLDELLAIRKRIEE